MSRDNNNNHQQDSATSSRLPFLDPVKKIIDYSKLQEGNLPFIAQPGRIPLINWDRINAEVAKLNEKRSATTPSKSSQTVGRLASLADVSKETAVQAMQLTGNMFAKHEKMHSYYRAQSVPTKGIVVSSEGENSSSDPSCIFENGSTYSDYFGTTREYGPWMKNGTHFYWYIREFVLQDAANPTGPSINSNALRLSCAHVVENENSQKQQQEVTFTVFCDVMPPLGSCAPKYRDDAVTRAVVSYITPPLSFVEEQDAAIVPALCEFSSEFKHDAELATKAALENNNNSNSSDNKNKNLVTHIQLVSKNDAMSTADAFSHLCESISWLARAHGCKYLIAEASNMRTATFLDDLGFLPIHYLRFQAKQRAIKSDVPVPEGASSPNGFLSDKDSGMIAMVCRLYD